MLGKISSQSQLLGVVTQMQGKETVTHTINSTDGRTTERRLACAHPQNILEPPSDDGYLCSDPISTYYIFTTYDSTRSITLMIQKRMDEI